jgi:pyrimidine-nucleoside phosphorylase
VLAETMVGLGRSKDTPVVAILTNMDQPLGLEVGNANEIVESIDVLKGSGPADVVELVMAFGEEMLVIGGVAVDRPAARILLESALADGSALEKFREVVIAQGGDPAVIDDPSLLPTAPDSYEVVATADGFVDRCDALAIGTVGVRLGAGRQTKDEDVDPGVGITIHAKVGDAVAAGASLATVRYRDRSRLDAAIPLLDAAWEITEGPPEPYLLILGEVE